MTTQKSITSYFCASKNTPKEMEKEKPIKRKLSLNRGDITPKLVTAEPAGVVEISSDDDSELFPRMPSPPSPASTVVLQKLSQSSLEEGMSSDSSSQTIIYTYSPKSLLKSTESQCSPSSSNAHLGSPKKSCRRNIESQFTPNGSNTQDQRSESCKKSQPNSLSGASMSRLNIFSSPEKSTGSTPKLTSTPSPTPHSSNANVNQSPKWSPKQCTPLSNRNTFFSPSKKRKVSKRSPGKMRRNLSDLFDKKCTPTEDETYLKACEGQDDKTKFLLKMINDFLKTKSLKKFLYEESIKLLTKYFDIPKPGMKLVCRLYWRKEGWYKCEQIKEICLETKKDIIEDKDIDSMLKFLVENDYLIEGSNMGFKDFTALLKAEELKEVCKTLKLRTQSKKGAVEALQEFSRRSSIGEYFGANNVASNSKRLLQIMSQKAGPCYKLSDQIRSILEKVYILTYLGIDYDYIRDKKLELMLINEKISRETFPVDKNMLLDNASVVFEDKDDFERYLFAHNIHEMYLSATETEAKCSYVRQAFEMFTNMDPNDIVKYKALPIWLQRFTPASIYVKLMDAGILELKKGKDQGNCNLAVDILSALIGQTFRQHKKAEWYAEKALILHSYLNNPEDAAYVLIEGFESCISDENKDFMRPRAKKIAQQKNINLDEALRKVLLDFGTKETILEGNIPSQHFYKQPMENTTKGKATYETKTESGRLMQGVEEYALSSYLLNGEYTHGGHWEGRIITTMFFLLFWGIVYSKPKQVSGIFLSHYQRFPMDMFTEYFYLNRREAIDKRLTLIEEVTDDEVVELMMIEWDNRPECEISGINRDIPLADIAAVAGCLGGKRLAAICKRLAIDYRHAHSGFPDLTLWNSDDRKIKFVEVKSDHDKPSMKQIQWMQYLLDNDIETEFCYVGANTTRPKSRKPGKAQVATPS